MGVPYFPSDPEVLDRISEAVFSFDRDWRITYMNKTAIEFLETRKHSKDLIGKNIWEEFPSLKELPHYTEILSIFETKHMLEFEFIGPISHKWRQIVLYPSNTGVSVIARDVSKIKAVEEKLREEKQWASDIVESIQDGFVVMDKNLTYLYANQKVSDMIGLPRESIIGKKLGDFFPYHNIDVGSMITFIKNAWLKHESAKLEIYFKPIDKWYSLFVYPFKDKFTVLYRDITESKLLQEELSHAEEKLDVVFKNVTDGIFIQDRNGKLVYVNESAAKMSGYKTSQDMLLDTPDYMKSFEMFDLSGKSLSINDMPARDIFSGKKKSGEVLLQYLNKKTDTLHWAIVKAAAIPRTKGDIKYVINIIHDITHLKEVEQQKDVFISMASHELKTPITSAKIYLQMLHRNFSGEHNAEARRVVGKVSANIDKLANIVNSILDVTRTRNGRLKLNKQPFSLSSLVEETVSDIQPITEHKISYASMSNHIVNADRDRISQVVVNFLMNAIKYSEGAKKIIVQVTEEDGAIRLSVQDFGLGIPKKDQKKIFQRFFQSEKHNTFPGLGLGLYISAEIIKTHGGKIGVKSTEGKGSTFYFSLPKYTQEV